jgi:hypothetical protein
MCGQADDPTAYTGPKVGDQVEVNHIGTWWPATITDFRWADWAEETLVVVKVGGGHEPFRLAVERHRVRPL